MATVTFDHVVKKYGDVTRGQGPQPRDRRRRVHGPGRPLGLRQDHQPADDRRARGDHRRHAPDRRPRRQRRRPQGSRHRDGLPELRALPAHDRPRQPRVRPQAAQGPQGRDRQADRRGREHPRSSSKLLDRKPKELSGGQRQRVALGRAIVREPAVFLMDEPLSNLDAKLRVQTRAEIARLHQRLGVTTVYVTHDQIEAMTMGQRIAVMSEGILQQVGTPQAALRPPGQPVRGRLHRQPGDELHGAQRRRQPSSPTATLTAPAPRLVLERGDQAAARSSPASGPSTSSWASSPATSRRSAARPTSSSTSATRSSST